MNPHQYDELERLRMKNAQLYEDKHEIRKLLGLVCEKIDSRSDLNVQDSKVHYSSVSRRGHSKDRNSKQVQHCQRVVGECAFQLNRRILTRMFPHYERLYGFSVSDIKKKILQLTTCPLTNKVDEAERTKLFERRHKLFNTLRQFGYDKQVHPNFTEYLVNTYGVLKHRPFPGADPQESYNCPVELRRMAAECMPCSDLDNVNIIIDCLERLAEEDGKPLFI
ncbi:hypothetical protein GDO78_000166 [Eleutherodactylus coqui]|uniref:Speriolin C-terminal domain-containing protein n=1 Tax=Eleutherodactylus coqui TaxID=57060 RepID=A0A8J6FP27_ELECQ|nr:hypothetical protein GDO78_000166 [Eleutherodactylus coqui]